MQAGRTCTLNYNTGTYGSPTWVHIGRVSSPSRTQGRPTSRKTYREANNSKNVTGLIDNEISGQYVQKNAGQADTILDALEDSLLNDTVLDIAMLDGPAATTGSTGIRGPFVVSQLDKSEDDEDAVVFDFTLVEVEDDTIAETTSYTIS